MSTNSHNFYVLNRTMVFPESLISPPSTTIHMRILSEIYHTLSSNNMALPKYKTSYYLHSLFLWKNIQRNGSHKHHIHKAHKSEMGQYHSVKSYDLRTTQLSNRDSHNTLTSFCHLTQTWLQHHLCISHLQEAISTYISQNVLSTRSCLQRSTDKTHK